MRVAERISGLLEGDRAIVLMVALLALVFLLSPDSARASEPVTIDGESVSGVTAHDATLEAQIDPHGHNTGYEFQIDTNGSYRYTQPVCPPIVPGSFSCMAIMVGESLPPGLVEPSPGEIPAATGDQAISVDLASIGTALEPGTTYHYRVIASNGGQIVDGPDRTFTTTPLVPKAPVIESESASNVTSKDATLEAQIDPQGLETTYEFYLEAPSCQSFGPGYCEASGGTPIASGTIPAGSSARTVSVDLANARGDLSPSTIYGYRIVATSSAGESFDGEKTFTTPPAAAPVVDSVSYSHLTPTDATLEAQIDTEGLPTTYQFTLWSSPCSSHGAGCEVLIDIPLPSGRLLGSFVDQSVSLDLNSAGVTLKGGEYGYSLRASNAAGSTVGEGGTFEPPAGVLDPPSTGASLPPAAGQPDQPGGGGGQTGGSGDSSASSTPGVKVPDPQVGKSAKLEPLTRAQKLARSLKACQSKPKKHRASCEKLARGRYGAAPRHKR